MYILLFDSTSANLANAGGKGENLARLTRAGFNVPPGFILSTAAYRDFVSENHLQPLIDVALRELKPADSAGLETASAGIRAAFGAGLIPQTVKTELLEQFARLEPAPVAVRSSATAEDLPGLSFAGQQDTSLNILGTDNLLEAVINCWSSLWTARAIGYRLRNDIPAGEVSLAVVVQQMVASEVSGVLFTANPLTGRLDESVIDATFGLGEALVSGQVEPDHFVIDSLSGQVKSASPGAKKIATRGKPGGGVENVANDRAGAQTLNPEQVQKLVQAGQAIQREYGSPQDIEWAFAGDRLFILQARAVTSLFPVPQVSFDPLIAWFSFGAVQGLTGPITPLGQDAIVNVAANAVGMFGMQPDPKNFKVLALSGERIWIRISDLMRNPIGKRIFAGVLSFVEPSVGEILKSLALDPRIGTGEGRLKFSTIFRLVRFALPVMIKFAHNMLAPSGARARFDRKVETELAKIRLAPADDRYGRLYAAVTLLRGNVANGLRIMLPAFFPVMGPSMAMLTLLRHLAQDNNLVFEVTRSLPDNVTTEMDLELWKTAQAIRQDAQSAEFFQAGDPDRLAKDYLSGSLPPAAQAAIGDFLSIYGVRGIGEIDFGQPRWREDPTPVMHTLQSYLNADPEHSPAKTFARGEADAQAAIDQITARLSSQPHGWIKARLARAAARRLRLMLGARETPKFFIVRTMAVARQALLNAGQEFAQAGTIEKPDDLVFLSMDELELMSRDGQPDGGWKALVASRRADYQRELRRRQVPRVLTSDGCAFYEGLGAQTQADGAISGSPVSPGVAEGIVHVVLDPRGTQLAPGEILVCPGTDPAWTPLFMVAAALITEVGGMMTHGSVVAREYGIPAVVGVHEATTRLKDGQRIRVDGNAGKIVFL